jgi:hypothetical protein
MMSIDHNAPPPPPRIGRGRFVVAALVFEGALAVVGWALGRWFGVAALAGLEPTAPAVGIGVLATVPLLGLLAVSLRSAWGPLAELRELVLAHLGPLVRDCSVLDLALIAAAAGFGEEVLFRGFLQVALTGWLPAWGALVVAAVLFGMVHALTRAYALIATLMGLYLGGLLLATDSLLVPVLVHGLYDLVALLVVRQLARR